MAKDEFIGIRVSKEFKRLLQREAKRKGMSLSEYLETTSTDKFEDTKKHIQELIARAKEDRPAFWQEAEKSQILREYETLMPNILSDLLNPLGHDPHHHALLMMNFIPLATRSCVVNLDSVHDDYKGQAASKLIMTSKIVAENLNKLHGKDKEEQINIIKEIKQLIESFAFSFTSLAFAKDSFVKIKEELDKTEKVLLEDVQKRSR
jgi:predicted HicB family RNase H-like nuclease